MDPLWMELAKQVPSLVVLVLLVGWFLKTLQSINADRKEVDKLRDESLERLGNNCHAFQRELAGKNERMHERVATVLESNATMMGKTIGALEDVEDAMSRIEHAVESVKQMAGTYRNCSNYTPNENDHSPYAPTKTPVHIPVKQAPKRT